MLLSEKFLHTMNPIVCCCFRAPAGLEKVLGAQQEPGALYKVWETGSE